MRFFKTTILILSAAVLASMFSCGDTGKDVVTGSGDVSENTIEPRETGEYTSPGVSFGGETVYVATHQWETPWLLARYDHVSEYEENGDVINDALVKRTRQIEDEFDVKLKAFVIKERYNPVEFTTAVASGDDEFAFGMVMSCAFPTLLGTEGMLTDLNSVDSIDLSHSWWNQNAVSEMNLFGMQYAALGDVNLYAKGSPIVTYFNKQIIEDYGLDNPYELVDNGKWTLDRMIGMAEAAASDINGDGKVDTDDRFGFMGENDSQVYLLTGCGVRFSTHDDKDINITIMSEKTVDAIGNIVGLINDNRVSMMNYTYEKDYNNVFFELFIPQLGANRALFFSNQLLASLNMRSLEVDFGVLPMPKYDENQESYSSFSNTWFTDYVVIPPTNTDTVRTGALIEAMNYYSQQYVVPAFIDNVVKNKSVRDEESAKIISDIIDNMQYDIALMFNWGDIQQTVTGMRGKQGQSYASVYESARSGIEADVEKTVEALKK